MCNATIYLLIVQHETLDLFVKEEGLRVNLRLRSRRLPEGVIPRNELFARVSLRRLFIVLRKTMQLSCSPSADTTAAILILTSNYHLRLTSSRWIEHENKGESESFQFLELELGRLAIVLLHSIAEILGKGTGIRRIVTVKLSFRPYSQQL